MKLASLHELVICHQYTMPLYVEAKAYLVGLQATIGHAWDLTSVQYVEADSFTLVVTIKST